MRTDTGAFLEKNSAASKSPRFTVQIAFDDPPTDFLYLTSDDDAEASASAIAAGEVIYSCIKGLSGLSQSIDPINAVATIGGFSFEVVDLDEAFTVYARDKLENGDGLRHKRIKVYVGFEGLAWSAYSNTVTYIVDSIVYRDGRYKIDCSDIQREARKDIFDTDETYLTATVTVDAALIPCTETDFTKFKAIAHDASYSDRPSAYVGYAMIEDEVFSHSGLTLDTSLGPAFVVLQRGALNTRATEHVLDDSAASDRRIKIAEHVHLEGPAPKIIYALLTGDLYNQFDASSPPAQETLPDGWHLGISTDFVRLADFTGIGDDLWNTSDLTGRRVWISGEKITDGKRFIERELLIWLGCFMPVYSSGELGLKRLAPILSNSGHLKVLDSSNVAEYSDLKHDFSAVINEIEIDWNYRFNKNDYTKTSYLFDAGSIAKHKSATKKTLKLKAVHTGAHTDRDLEKYFDTMRDRYSGPPLKISVTVRPSLNNLEVGDTVRLVLDQVRDFNVPGATTIDRVFEVQRVQTDYFTGNVKLDLFGSSQAAGPISRTALSAVLDDAFYSSAGTELSTVLTISGGAVTANGSLTGASTMAAGVYYYLGDLTINSGVTVTTSENVQLRVMGALTINGTIDGAGNGHTGGAGATAISSIENEAPVTNQASGTAGALGPTQAQSGITSVDEIVDRLRSNYELPVLSALTAVPFYNIANNSTSIAGLPTDLRGSSGGGGAGAVGYRPGSGWAFRANGGAGGAGGAGLMIICRGLSFGASGNIDTSGDPGSNGANWTDNNGHVLLGGAGGAGAPGGLAIFIDGNYTPPDLGDEHVGNYGDTTILSPIYTPDLVALAPADQYSGYYQGIHGYDMGASAYRVQYVPVSTAVSEEIDPPPPDVTGFTVGISGSTVVFRWLEVIDNNLEGYEIRYSRQTISAWDSALPLTRSAAGTRITDTAINDGNWRFYIKARDANGQYSQNAATYDATIETDFDIIETSAEHPDWLGTKTNFVKHWTGKLIPSSQNGPLAIDFPNETVSNPYPTCTYETSELDVAFDDTVRASIETLGELFPGETGQVAITNYIDYKLAAGSYDGFEAWESGEVEARYIKFKFELDTTQGVAFIDECTITADLIERVESAESVAISASGETITFAQAYHVAPAVRVDYVGTSAVFAVVSNITTTGFDVDCYNTSGTGVAGTINWRAEGV